MVRYYELSDEENVLLEVERGALSSNDISNLLGNINLSFASNILRSLWGRRLLTRKKITKENGGIKYLYSLSNSGEKFLNDLHERGY
jgi:predicted transcriptional regulator